jgi:sarcosine oxidase, subunit gamma
MSRSDPVWVSEPICERRLGLKGPRAAAALADAGFTVPARPNTWAPLGAGEAQGSWNVIARLGNTEFFLEETGAAPRLAGLEALLARGLPGAYPVLREDTAIVLGGAAACEALAETCSVPFAQCGEEAGRPIHLTLMIGVGVLVLPQVNVDDGPIYRIWCDPSYGAYLWGELEQIVTRITTEKTDERQ